MKRPVSIVVPICDGVESLKRNLPALTAELEMRGHQDELIIVDDSGSEDVASWLQANTHQATHLAHSTPKGYGRALMTGGLAAKHELVLLLSPEVATRPGSIDALVDALVDDVLAVRPSFGAPMGAPKDARTDTKPTATAEPSSKPSSKKGWNAFFFELLGTPTGADFALDIALLLRKRDLPNEATAELLAPCCIDPAELGQRAQKMGSRTVQAAASSMDYRHVEPAPGSLEAFHDFVLGRNVLLAHWLHLGGRDEQHTHVQKLKEHAEGFARLGRTEPLRLLVAALSRMKEVRTARRELQLQRRAA